MYYRSVRFSPRMMVVHVVTIDLTMPGLKFMVTPGNLDAEMPLSAMTTSQFLDQYDLQIAVNGDGFTPWYSNSILDYYPHVGDPVTPNGFASSQGMVYNLVYSDRPTLNIASDGRIRVGDPIEPAYDAVSGDVYLVRYGEPVPGLDDSVTMPRTAVGISASSMVLVVVDGRQPFYSQGMTFAELSEVMVSYGVTTAMSLDGGGSSTLVVEGADGRPRVLNSPIDNNIPGRERAVGNHLGIYTQR
jgi:exopolysaccharide biosynthesis protein